jgi:hypothetical protein
LKHVSNAKLIRLHDTLSEVKDQFGTRAKLIEAVLEVENRSKDQGYKIRLEGYPVPRLWDQYKSSKRRAARGTAPAEEKPAAKKAPAKKAAPKKARAKKAAEKS